MAARSLNRVHEERTTWELNLAPMLDMMCALMCVLLMAFSTIKIGIVETQLPQPVASALEKDREKKDRELTFHVTLNDRRDATVLIKQKDGSEQKTVLAAQNGVVDLKGLHQQAVQLKVKHPGIFRIELNPSEVIPYKEVVQVMDELRHTRGTDPKVYVKDEKTGGQVETYLMFPDIIFANVVEG